MFSNYPDNPALDDYADASREAADLREQVAVLQAEVNELNYAVTSARAENDRLNGLLTRAYDTRYQTILWMEKHICDLTAREVCWIERYRAARKVLARRRADYLYRGQFIEKALADAQPVPAPAACRTCGGSGVVTREVVKMDAGGAYTTQITTVCPDCADQACEACDGTGSVTVANCGEWEERDCPDCAGFGARPGTALAATRAAKRAADIEAARLAADEIPF